MKGCLGFFLPDQKEDLQPHFSNRIGPLQQKRNYFTYSFLDHWNVAVTF